MVAWCIACAAHMLMRMVTRQVALDELQSQDEASKPPAPVLSDSETDEERHEPELRDASKEAFRLTVQERAEGGPQLGAPVQRGQARSRFVENGLSRTCPSLRIGSRPTRRC